MLKKIIVILFIFSFKLFAQSVTPVYLTIASQDIPPFFYTTKDGAIEGFFYQIVKDVCDQAKIDCQFKIYPFRRTQQYLRQGDVHICAPMAISLEREKEMSFSEVVYSSGYEFFGKKSYISTIKDIHSIQTNIGVHSPSSTYNALLKTVSHYKMKLRIKEETDVEMVFEKLKKGRYDLVFMNKDISKKWASENNSKEAEFISYDKYISPIDYRIAYTKAQISPEHTKLLNLFKKNLTIYLKGPKFKKLINSY